MWDAQIIQLYQFPVNKPNYIQPVWCIIGIFHIYPEFYTTVGSTSFVSPIFADNCEINTHRLNLATDVDELKFPFNFLENCHQPYRELILFLWPLWNDVNFDALAWFVYFLYHRQCYMMIVLMVFHSGRSHTNKINCHWAMWTVISKQKPLALWGKL